MNRRTVETLQKYDGYIIALYNCIVGAITEESLISTIINDIQETGSTMTDSEISDIVDILTEWGVVNG